jgi:molybdate transport system ATP-binding protein
MRAGLRTLLIVTRPEDLPDETTHALAVEDCRVVRAGPRADALRRAEPPPGPTPRANAPARPVPSRAPRELVRLEKVSVRYGGAVVFENLDWVIREGEGWALLGPNGSGKTTLVSLITGDHPQCYSNRVTIFGKRRGEGELSGDLRRRIGWFSPELLLSFDEDASCFEVVASGFRDSIGLFEPPTPGQRAAARRLLKQYGLSDCAELPLRGLSAGTQRIVLLLRALVKKPRLLILDEPCQGLDAAHRQAFIGVVDAAVGAASVAVIFVTHRDDELPPSISRTLRLPLSRRARR